jgi:hypothetical protein
MKSGIEYIVDSREHRDMTKSIVVKYQVGCGISSHPHILREDTDANILLWNVPSVCAGEMKPKPFHVFSSNLASSPL